MARALDAGVEPERIWGRRGAIGRRGATACVAVLVAAIAGAGCSSMDRAGASALGDSDAAGPLFDARAPIGFDEGGGAGVADDAGTEAADDAPAGDDASGPSDSGGDVALDAALAVDAGPPACDPARTWTNQGRIASLDTTSFARFGGVSRDEQTVAFTTSTGAVDVADRASSTAGFDAPSVVDAGTSLAIDRVALAPTGLTVIAVSSDRASFVAFNRTGRAGTWTLLPPSQFANVVATVSETGGAFSEPVLGADGTSFFFLLTVPGAPPVLFESTWSPAELAWTAGSALPNPELASSDATHRRRPTGESDDGLTLFFFDETTGAERAAWRASTSSPFTQFVDLTGFAEAAPALLCGALYFEGTGASGAGVFIAR